MFLGTQFRARDDDDYRVMAQLGYRTCLRRPRRKSARLDPRYSRGASRSSSGFRPCPRHDPAAAELACHREAVQSGHPLRRARSRPPDQLDLPLIERAAAAGIPAAKYNLNIIGIPRTDSKRAGADHATTPFAGTRPIRSAANDRRGR